MTYEKSSERRDIYKERRKMSEADAKAIAKRFHEAYERLAPEYGYETRHDTREFDPESPNGKLMTAVCLEVGRFIECVAFEEGFRAGWEESTPELRRHVAAAEAELAAAKAEVERLRMYREIAEDLISAFLSANEVVLAHFDENDQLRGNGQWRLKEIIKAAKRADQANRKAARASDVAAGQESDE